MKDKKNILEKAQDCVSNTRLEQYGDQKKNFAKYAEITNLLLDKEELASLHEGIITDKIVVKVMMDIKLGRESYKHKEDNLVDLCGYSAILEILNN